MILNDRRSKWRDSEIQSLKFRLWKTAELIGNVQNGEWVSREFERRKRMESQKLRVTGQQTGPNSPTTRQRRANDVPTKGFRKAKMKTIKSGHKCDRNSIAPDDLKFKFPINYWSRSLSKLLKSSLIRKIWALPNFTFSQRHQPSSRSHRWSTSWKFQLVIIPME